MDACRRVSARQPDWPGQRAVDARDSLLARAGRAAQSDGAVDVGAGPGGCGAGRSSGDQAAGEGGGQGRQGASAVGNRAAGDQPEDLEGGRSGKKDRLNAGEYTRGSGDQDQGVSPGAEG